MMVRRMLGIIFNNTNVFFYYLTIDSKTSLR